MMVEASHGRSGAAEQSSGSGLNVVPDAAGEREHLAARLAAIRQQRIADEVEGNELPQLLRAIIRVRRDRDSGMTYRLRAHRDHLERVFADAEDLVFSVLEVNFLIHVRGLEPGDPLVHEASRAARRGREAVDRLNRDLVGGGA